MAPIPSNLAAIAFAVAGALVVLGGTFLNPADGLADDGDGFEFWLAFVIGGVLMIGLAYVMSIGTRVAQLVATVVLLAMILVFGFAVDAGQGDAAQLTAFGFIAGGLVVGVAVLFSGSLRQSD
jgi:hypothetical protein